MDSELARQVIADLRYLESTWTLRTIDDDFLRRDSAVLRRLLVDDGGLLNRYRSELGLGDEITVTSPDLDHFVDGLDKDRIQLAVAGGATHNGVHIGPVLKYAAMMSAEVIRRRASRGPGGPPEQTLDLPGYLRAPCVIVQGTPVPRQHLIQYMSNKLGGVHWDPLRVGRKAKDASFAALDSVTGTANLAGKDPVYFELLAIGQCLLKAPQIATLLAD